MSQCSVFFTVPIRPMARWIKINSDECPAPQNILFHHMSCITVGQTQFMKCKGKNTPLWSVLPLPSPHTFPSFILSIAFFCSLSSFLVYISRSPPLLILKPFSFVFVSPITVWMAIPVRWTQKEISEVFKLNVMQEYQEDEQCPDVYTKTEVQWQINFFLKSIQQ